MELYYGVAEKSWFHGVVQGIQDTRFEQGDTRRIVEMTEYHNAQWKCSSGSYYEI